MIKIKSLTMIYKDHHETPALEDINIDIEKGEFVFVVGSSGSGKSTLVRILIRELIPTAGEVFISGQDITTMRSSRIPYLRRSMGCVFQDFKLLPNKTAFENVAFALEVIGKPRYITRKQVPEILKLVGLEDSFNKFPNQLSGGEQQRVSIARAFINRPPILLADEPTGNLDPETSQGIMSLLDRINQTGTTVVMATHDREMVDAMRKRVIELENGHIIRDQLRGVYGYER